MTFRLAVPVPRAQNHVVEGKWRSHCLCCMRVWEDLYEARYCGGAVAWQFGGMPAQPPWVDRACPGCGSLGVKVHSVGLAV